MSRPIRWGVLGAGGIAATVGADIAATNRNVLHSVAARHAARAAVFAAAHGYARSHDSYAELLANPKIQGDVGSTR